MPTIGLPRGRPDVPNRPGRTVRAGINLTKISLLLLLALAPSPPGATAAEPTTTFVPDNWPLKPSGVSVGVPFRLVFVTSTTRNARSTDADVYSAFVQSAAQGGHASIRPYAGAFDALVSTTDIAARDHTGTNGSTEAMYWLNGAKVADNAADFYDGSWDSDVARNESGTVIQHSTSNPLLYTTGSDDDGTRMQIGSTYFTVGEDEEGNNSFNQVQTGALPVLEQRFGPIRYLPLFRTLPRRLLAVSSPLRAVPTVSLSAARTSARVTEGAPISIGFAPSDLPRGSTLHVRVRITDDPNSDFLDEADEGVHTFTVTRNRVGQEFQLADPGRYRQP